MFFVLSKLLLFLLSPLFWFLLCVGLFFFWKKARWKKHLKWTAVGIFFFFTNTVIYSTFCGLWEAPGVRPEKLGRHDVAIVLGGMAEYNNDLDVLSFRRPGDRLFQAITLYKTGKVRKILISGDSGHLTDRGLHEAKQIKKLLIQWGIPKQDLIAETHSINTYQNARETKKLLDKSYPELKTFVLITSGTHMRRALGCFEKQGMKCTPYPTDLYTNRSGHFQWDQYLIPNTDNFYQWRDLLKEMFGYATYDVVGYI